MRLFAQVDRRRQGRDRDRNFGRAWIFMLRIITRSIWRGKAGTSDWRTLVTDRRGSRVCENPRSTSSTGHAVGTSYLSSYRAVAPVTECPAILFLDCEACSGPTRSPPVLQQRPRFLVENASALLGDHRRLLCDVECGAARKRASAARIIWRVDRRAFLVKCVVVLRIQPDYNYGCPIRASHLKR
jgi:hypothetical protein